MVTGRSPSRTFRVLVTSSWVPGGVTTWTHEFANHLADRGHEVTCIFVKMKWPLLRKPPFFRDVRYKVIWLEASPTSFVSAVPRFLASYLRQYPIDIIVSTEAEGTNIPTRGKDATLPVHIAVIHISEPANVTHKDLVLSMLGLGNAVLLTPLWVMQKRYDLVDRMMPGYWQWVQYLAMRRLEKAPVVVCVSQAQSHAVQRIWGIPDAKIQVIYNGIDTATFRPLAQLEGRERRLLFVGGSNPRKGIDVLLDAFALVSKFYPDVLLDLVGGWNWNVQIERAKRSGISSKVRFHPYIVHEEMPTYYAQSYAFIAPTRAESFGRTVAEAMACGVPVISTQASSIPEIVDEGVSGLLVPWGDTNALADAILELLNDPQKASEIGRAGRKRVEKSFAWDVIMLQWEELFERIWRELCETGVSMRANG